MLNADSIALAAGKARIPAKEKSDESGCEDQWILSTRTLENSLYLFIPFG